MKRLLLMLVIATVVLLVGINVAPSGASKTADYCDSNPTVLALGVEDAAACGSAGAVCNEWFYVAGDNMILTPHWDVRCTNGVLIHYGQLP